MGDRIVGTGSAPNKQVAKNVASRNALENLGWPVRDYFLSYVIVSHLSLRAQSVH